MRARSTTVPDTSVVESEPSAPLGPLRPGTVFGGRYRILRHVASGGMGSVYEVLHLETQRRRALKVMHPHLFRSHELRERFKREARIAADIHSEHIVDVSDAGVDEATDTPFLVMELLQGEELGHRLERLGRLPAAEVVTVLSQVALALDKTHAKSIVHRDLKPENLFVTHREDGAARVKILDFGLAKVVAEGSHAAGTTGRVGTPLYMAPEQLRSGSRLTKAADIYAMGMMAYTLLVGSAYWAREAESHEDLFVFAVALAAGPVESAVGRAAAKGVELPPAFDAWFSRATALEIDRRFGSASEAASALSEALGVVPDERASLLASSSVKSSPSSSAGSGRLALSATVPVGLTVGAAPRGRRAQLFGAATFAVVVGALAIVAATRPERRDSPTAVSAVLPIASVEVTPVATAVLAATAERAPDPTLVVPPSLSATPSGASAPTGTFGAGQPPGASAPTGTFGGGQPSGASAASAIGSGRPPGASAATATLASGQSPSPGRAPAPAATEGPSSSPPATPSSTAAKAAAPAPTPTSLFGRDD